MSRTSRTSVMLSLVMIAAVAACAGSDDPVADPVAEPEVTPTTALRPEGYDGDWCVSARRIAAASSVMDAVDPTDAAAVEEAVTEMLAEAEAAAPLAPPAIAADVAAALESFREIDAALAAADYDLLQADLSGVAEDPGPSERVDAYNVEVCGLEPDEPISSGADGALDPTAGPIRDQLIATFVERGFTVEEASCVLDHVDVSDPGRMADPEVLADLVETCDIDLERLTEATGSTAPAASGADG